MICSGLGDLQDSKGHEHHLQVTAARKGPGAVQKKLTGEGMRSKFNPRK
jgi:hypothetical protein